MHEIRTTTGQVLTPGNQTCRVMNLLILSHLSQVGSLRLSLREGGGVHQLLLYLYLYCRNSDGDVKKSTFAIKASFLYRSFLQIIS